jgi:hypothetical protein
MVGERQAKLGKTHSALTKEIMSKVKGTPLILYKVDPNSIIFIWEEGCIKNFTSFRSLGKYLGISQTTVARYCRNS